MSQSHEGSRFGKVRFFSERCRHKIICALVYLYFLLLSTPMLLLDHRIYHIKVYKVAWPELYGSPHWQQSLVLHSRFCYHKLISLSWELGNIWCTQQCKFTTRAGSSVCLGRQDARVLWRPGNLHLLWSRGTGRGYPSARTENHIEIHYMLGETDTWWKQWFHKLGDQKRQGRWQH